MSRVLRGSVLAVCLAYGASSHAAAPNSPLEMAVVVGMDGIIEKGVGPRVGGQLMVYPSSFPRDLRMNFEVTMGPLVTPTCDRWTTGACHAGILQVLADAGSTWRVPVAPRMGLLVAGGLGVHLMYASLRVSDARNAVTIVDLDAYLGIGMRADLTRSMALEYDFDVHLLTFRDPLLSTTLQLCFALGKWPEAVVEDLEQFEDYAVGNVGGTTWDTYAVDATAGPGDPTWIREGALSLIDGARPFLSFERDAVKMLIDEIHPSLSNGDLVVMRGIRGAYTDADVGWENDVVLVYDPFFILSPDDRARAMARALAYRWIEHQVDSARDFLDIGWDLQDRPYAYSELTGEVLPLGAGAPTQRDSHHFPLRFELDALAASSPVADLAVSIELYLYQPVFLRNYWPERFEWIRAEVFHEGTPQVTP